jgi:hypothetical protein
MRAVVSDWSPHLRLTAFGLLLVVTFGLALAIGAVVG